MSAEQWDAFLEKIESDTQLQEKLKEVTTPEAAITIAKAAGYSITADDIQAEEEDELSLEELGSVAANICHVSQPWAWSTHIATDLSHIGPCVDKARPVYNRSHFGLAQPNPQVPASLAALRHTDEFLLVTTLQISMEMPTIRVEMH